MSTELHTCDTPNGRNISIALEEISLPYTVHPVNIFKGEQFDPALMKINPNSRIPSSLIRQAQETSRSASLNRRNPDLSSKKTGKF
jgi:GST-like protein